VARADRVKYLVHGLKHVAVDDDIFVQPAKDMGYQNFTNTGKHQSLRHLWHISYNNFHIPVTAESTSFFLSSIRMK